MRPTAPLFKRLKTRLRFTTKQVAKGFYRGSNTGSLGAHTQHGEYVIDWRKARHYVVPDLRTSKLTPFVSGQIPEREKLQVDPSGKGYGSVDGQQYLRWWKDQNPSEFDWFLQREMQEEALAREEARVQAEAQALGQEQEQQTGKQEQPQPTR